MIKNNIIVVDNYDSFTYNLVQYLGQLGATVEVVRNDQVAADAVVAPKKYDGILVSPGPGNPSSAGISKAVIDLAAQCCMPVLGVCLGHQSIVEVFGGAIVNAQQIMHGKISKIKHDNKGVFKGLSNPLTVVRYHSLAAESTNMPQCLEVSARADDDEIMGIRHVDLPIEGVQFHPESIASEQGLELLENWLNL